MADILFVNKYREIKSEWEDPRVAKNINHKVLSSGLNNSVKFINAELTKTGLSSVHEHVLDSNHIYKEINRHKPKVVIIEALWAMPAKFVELSRLYPNIKWIIRLHSDLPFIANEGMFASWFFQYLNIKNMFISCNSKRMYASLKHFVKDKLLYLPNFYPISQYDLTPNIRNIDSTQFINIGCFGAIRPLKNTFLQAFAAIEIANSIGKSLNFHINATRIENKSENIVKNLNNLFTANKKHTLVKHYWLPHNEFLDVLSQLDISLQISLSETFNIVAADSVSMNVPTLVSDEIYWADDKFKVHPTNYDGVMSGLKFIYENRNEDFIYKDNKSGLKSYCDGVIPIWKLELSKIY